MNIIEKKDEGFKFKKGFFLRDPEKENKTSSIPAKEEKKPDPKVLDLTHLKSTGETIKDKIFTEFKKEVKENSEDINKSLNYISDKKAEWCSSDLLSMISQKPNLMKFFLDPRFAEAMQLMQKDPEKFMQIYGKNPDFNEFIKEFSGIMANHFNSIGDIKKDQSPPIDREVDKIINEPKVKMVIEKLQKEGKLDVNQIQRDPELSRKIKILIDKGFLKLQRE